MKLKDCYSYDHPFFSPIRAPARRVVEAFQNAARWLDTVQEWVYIEAGMPNAARLLHDLAHEMPKRFDAFGDLLHERHLMVEYPATEELTEPIDDMDKAFEVAVSVLDDCMEALEAFHAVTDIVSFRPMALGTEELMAVTSRDYTRILEAWQMWDQGVSASGFDSWVRHLREEGCD